jgi:hypothetical protein
MLDNIEERVYTRLPERVRPVAQKWFYVLNPRLSWQYRKKPEEVDETFVDRFFADRDEFERYRTEFAESGIGDICMDAESETPAGYTIFDAHRKDAMKYYAIVRKVEPDTVVESGVYNGVSTASVLLALEENDRGRLHSVDYSAALRDDHGTADDRRAFYERERPSCSEPGSSMLVPGRNPGWILPERLRDRWELVQGRPQAELPRLYHDHDEIDVFLHDSEHSTSCMLYEFELAWEWLGTDGLILSSHVQWNDAYETFVEERDCEAGLTTFHYLGYEGEKVPCSTAYIRKT